MTNSLGKDPSDKLFVLLVVPSDDPDTDISFVHETKLRTYFRNAR
jgi:hypothetical protein